MNYAKPSDARDFPMRLNKSQFDSVDKKLKYTPGDKQIPSDYLSIDNSDVQDVLGIANEIVREGKLLTFEGVYDRAWRKLKIPKKNIKDIIRYLKMNCYIIERKAYTKQTVLENEYRKRILDLITSHKVVHFNFLRRAMHTERNDGSHRSSGQFMLHVGALMIFNYVKSTTLDINTLFFPSTMNQDEAIITYLTRDLLIHRILGLLLETTSLPRSEIVNTLIQMESNEWRIYSRITKLLRCDVLSEDSNREIRINETKLAAVQSVLNHTNKE